MQLLIPKVWCNVAKFEKIKFSKKKYIDKKPSGEPLADAWPTALVT